MSTQQDDRRLVADSYKAIMTQMQELLPHSQQPECTFLPSASKTVGFILREINFSPNDAPSTMQFVSNDTSQSKVEEESRPNSVHVPATGSRRTFKTSELQRIQYELKKRAVKVGMYMSRSDTPVDDNDELNHIQEAASEFIDQREVIRELVEITHVGSFELRQLCNSFRQHSNQSQVITKSIFHQVIVEHLQGQGHVPRTGAFRSILDRLFYSFDKDQNGTVDFREFVLGLSGFVARTMEQKVDALFDAYDADGSGTISVAEFFQLIHGSRNRLSDMARYVENYFSLLDQDGDHVVTLVEFLKAIESEPTILDALRRQLSLSCVCTISHELRCLSERLRLTWAALLQLYETFQRDGASKDIFYTAFLAQLKDHYEPSDETILQQVFEQYSSLDPSKKIRWKDLILNLSLEMRSSFMAVDLDQARLYFRLLNVDGDESLCVQELLKAICGEDAATTELIQLFNKLESNGHLTKAHYLIAAQQYPLVQATLNLCV